MKSDISEKTFAHQKTPQCEHSGVLVKPQADLHQRSD
jgi:hypothetical protein